MYLKKLSSIPFLVLLIGTGSVIVALPDNNNRIFSLSKAHGPSFQDAIGLLLILLAYGILVAKAWRRRARVLSFRSSRFFPAALFFFGLGHGLIIASVLHDYRWWWVPGTVILVLCQGVLFYLAFKSGR